MSGNDGRSRRGARRIALLAGLGILAAVWWVSGQQEDGPGQPRLEAAHGPGGLTDLEVLSLDLEFYESRVRRDPESAADLATLASLYLRRSRVTSDYEDFRRAERAARQSLALRRDRNASAYLNLASSLLAQHFFGKALEVARELTAIAPEKAHHRALQGEIELELGLYEQAAATFARLGGERRNLAVLPRLARWAEIRGQIEEARGLLQAALDEVGHRSDLSDEQVAWFYLRAGDLELRNGRLDAAEAALGAGLARTPADQRLLAALARLEAVRGEWAKALLYARRAVGITPDIPTVALIGDAWMALGEPGRAEAAYREVERMAAETPEPYNRAWTLFRIDHGRELSETVAILREELETRRDVYGHDQLAWGLYRSGDYGAAREAMAGALRMGTQDAVLFFHAGMIERALGSWGPRGRTWSALAINPHFHPTWPDVARRVLDSLDEAANQERM